jgi:TolA-binding protein
MGFKEFEHSWAHTQPALDVAESAFDGSTPDLRPDLPVRWNLIGLVVLAVVLGATLSLAAHEFVGWRSRVAFDNMMRADRDELRQSQLRVQKLQLEAQQRDAQRELQLERQLRLQALIVQQQVEDDARQAAIDATDRNAKAREKRRHKTRVIAGAPSAKAVVAL